MGEPMELETIVRGHRIPRRISGALLGGLIAAIVGAEWLASHHAPSLRLGARFGGIGIVLALAFYSQWGEKLAVRVTSDAIQIGKRRYLRSTIDSASMVRAGDESRLALVGPGLTLAVDGETGAAIQRTLGLDASHKVAKFTVPGRLATTAPVFWNPAGYRLIVLVWLVPLLSAWKLFHLPQHLVWWLMGVGGAFMTALIAPSTLQVGADGIVVRWLGTRRYVPFTDVASVDELKRFGTTALRFTLRDGRTFDVVGAAPKDDPALARIREAMKVEAAVAPTSHALLLERGSRTPRAWLDHLRALGTGAAATLRSADVDLDALWTVVDDPKAKTSLRIAAAVALAGRAEEGVVERLRVATEASASPRLRVAIDAAGKGDDAALEAALAEEIAEEAKETG